MQSRPIFHLPARLRPLLWLAICFIAISFVERLVLLLMAGPGVPHNPLYWGYAFGVGLGYDFVTFIYFAWPLVLFLWLVPSRPGRFAWWQRWLAYAGGVGVVLAIALAFLHWHYAVSLHTARPLVLPFLFVLPCAAFTYSSRLGQWALRLLCILMLFVMLFASAADITFWNEFGTRFNFVAVDYLVYTQEVIGNITESYPIWRWLGMLVAGSLLITWLTRRALTTDDDTSRFDTRTLVVAAWLCATVATAFVVNTGLKDTTRNAFVNSLAGNGIYEFFAAFHDQQLDFHKQYQNLPDSAAYATVRKLLKTPNATYIDAAPHDLTRAIRDPGKEDDLNVVIIQVESLSASFLGVFGNQHGLTPFLDQLAHKSLFFDDLYANGTRTVRGLEAVTLSVPPTPGNSLIHQTDNANLFSLGEIFDHHGYVSEFVYGGYSEFDRMKSFFSGNGYRVVDRRDVPPDMVIHGENAWGVSDEDLFTLAMRQMDKIHAQGKPFFLHLMTTSNHRPYTWPAGRVDLPQGGRAGAVKYTDWAIGNFIQRMRAKPYFKNTVFVITADHCAHSSGISRIPLNHYHIPLFIYAPAHIQARTVHRLMAQIDIAPTLLALLHFNYRSRFFGHDVLALPAGRERAFPSTYINLGYYRDARLTILMPKGKVLQVKPDVTTGAATPLPELNAALARQAIAYYQVAYDEFDSGRMRWRPSDGTPVPKISLVAAPPDGSTPPVKAHPQMTLQ